MQRNGDGRLAEIRDKVEAGQRLAFDDGVFLYDHADLFTLGELANLVRERKNGPFTYYNVNTQIAWVQKYQGNPSKYWGIFQCDPTESWYGQGFAYWVDGALRAGQLNVSAKTYSIISGKSAYGTVIATGSGDIPIRLWRRARQANIPLQIEGCDLNPFAVEQATAAAAGTASSSPTSSRAATSSRR